MVVIMLEELEYIEERRLINIINEYLYENFNSYLNNEKKEEFFNEYVRTGQEIIQENIEYFGIKCPYEFLDKKEILARDEDYIKLDYGYYLNVNKLSDGISEELISLAPYTYRGVDEQEEIEIHYGKDEKGVWLHIIDPDCIYGQSVYFLIDARTMGITEEEIIRVIEAYVPNAQFGI